MPGTPVTSPRVGAPRYANTDAADYAGQTNAVTDAFDAKVGIFLSGLASARPAAGIAERYHYATDTGELTRDTGSAWVGPLNPRSRTIVTALPVSPFTGQEILFQDATVLAAANTIWPLRYDGTKWVPIGCTPLYAGAIGVVSTTLTTPQQLSGGPSIQTPLAGDYLIELEVGVFNGTAGASSSAGIFVGGVASPQINPAALTIAASNYTTVSTFGKHTGAAAGATIEARYYVSAGTGNWSGRNLKVTPLRLG